MAIINSTPEARVYISTDDPRGMRKVVTTQFDKSDTTLANITGLSVDVEAGKTYILDAVLHTMGGDGKCKFAVSGTVTPTYIIGIIESLGLIDPTLFFALDTVLAGGLNTGYVTFSFRLSATLSVSVSGTVTIQFAQYSEDAIASSVMVGSYMELREVI